LSDPKIVKEQIMLFAQVAELYRAGLTFDDSTLADPLQALSVFVGGYAYERQGRSPSYGPVASDVIRQIGTAPNFWEDEDSAKQVWRVFQETLERRTNSKPNPKNNPLCCSGCVYGTGKSSAKVKGLSIVEFIQSRLKSQNYNVVRWAKGQLEAEQTREAHRALCSINGIGPKIASFFLRDVAWHFGVCPKAWRALLQPIDIWVKRAANVLDPASNGREAEWIVQTSLGMDVVPEAINAGIWYFGALIAGSEYRLAVAMGSRENAHQLVVDYIRRVTKQVRAWPGMNET
jgi:hypothetical protein